VTIREVSDEKLLELALIENIQRQELNPIEEARAFRKLIDTIGLTQEQVSERVGKERTLIATTLRLLKLPTDIQA
jgi:ParB family chromosome partitioning protein